MKISPVQEILANCKGQRVKLPVLFSLTPAWKPKLNPNHASVEASVEQWRRNWLPDTSSYLRNVTVNGALFARAACPEASVSKSEIVGKYGAWVFAWDDPIDFGELDEEQRELYRVESIEVIRRSLLSHHDHGPAKVSPTFPLAQSFYEIGVQMREGPKLEPIRRLFCETLCDYVNGAIRVQNPYEDGRLLSLDEYLDIRIHSSGVYPTIAIALYAQDTEIPAWLLDHPVVKEMMKQTCIAVSLDNDTVSVCQELRVNHIDNMIPLSMYNKSLTPQEAVDYTSQLIHEAYASFRKLEPELLCLAVDNDVLDAAQVFLDCCKNVRAGLVFWSYAVRRYGEYDAGNRDEEVSVILGA
ncbi:isoprenoid synthase domain-containing protein [Aspergillus unguis]